MDQTYDDQKIWVILCYVLHLLGAVFGLPSLIALVINYVRKDVALPDLATHHRWMIRTFWWALFWTVLSILTWVFIVGMVLAGAVWLWWMYRHIRGLIRLADALPMP